MAEIVQAEMSSFCFSNVTYTLTVQLHEESAGVIFTYTVLNSIQSENSSNEHIWKSMLVLMKGYLARLTGLWGYIRQKRWEPLYWGIVMHCIPEAIPIICHQVGPAPYKEWRAFSTCFPNTAQLIRYSFMDNYYAVSSPKALKKRKKREPTDLPSVAPSLHPLPFSMLPFHRYYYVIKPRSKDSLPNSSTMRAEDSFASGVVGLQRM